MDRLDRWHPFTLELIGIGAGFLLGIALILGGVYLLYEDKKLEGFSALATGILTLALPYFLGRDKKSKKHRQDTSKEKKISS